MGRTVPTHQPGLHLSVDLRTERDVHSVGATVVEGIELSDARVDHGTRVPVDVDGHKIYFWGEAERIPEGLGDEVEIGARRLSLDGVLGDLSALASKISASLQSSSASRVTIEFGCEFALESGTIVAVVGKAASKSTFKVGLDWTRSTV